jgi:isoquinoline 1-oxidoreductase beta subunit
MSTVGARLGKQTFSRREFIKGGAGLTFAIALGPAGVSVIHAANSSHLDGTSIGAWVTIATDGSTLIYNPAAEMGQGSMTALPVILAEEMDADWSKVRIRHSPVEPEIYGRGGWGGSKVMMTVGSRAVQGYFTPLRIAGAQIRRVLLDNAAEHWQLPVGELTTEPGEVLHAPSGRRLSYGQIASFAQVAEQLPPVNESLLKSPDQFRLIGHSVPRHDIPSKTDGSAVFAMDIHPPGMLYGTILRSPVHNGRPESYNPEQISAMPGITDTVVLDHGVGIIGESIEAVLKARDALKIDWASGNPAENFDSEQALAGYHQILDGAEISPSTVAESGDAPSAMKRAVKTYQSDYLADHVYHAQMEPLNAVVWVNEAGDGAEAWVGTQFTSGARAAIAEELGVSAANINLHPCYLGGGFGRRSRSDFVIEATQLSRAVRRPVKLIWTREDDLQYGMFRPMCLQRLQAGVDDDGNVTAWTHSVVGDGGRLLLSGIEIPFYDIPNQLIDMRQVSHGIRLKHWRAVAHGFNKFAIESFIDEIATDLSIDPYQLRKNLLRKSPRAMKVLDTVAEMSGWGRKAAEGRAFGMAFGERSDSLAAGVAEISLDESTGAIRVHRFIIMGLSSILKERVTIRNGRVQQSNFHDYPILRMSEIPEIQVEFVASEEHPSGLGETGLPLTGGAVANAFAALTGRRLRHLPFVEDRIAAVMS